MARAEDVRALVVRLAAAAPGLDLAALYDRLVGPAPSTRTAVATHAWDAAETWQVALAAHARVAVLITALREKLAHVGRGRDAVVLRGAERVRRCLPAHWLAHRRERRAERRSRI